MQLAESEVWKLLVQPVMKIWSKCQYFQNDNFVKLRTFPFQDKLMLVWLLHEGYAKEGGASHDGYPVWPGAPFTNMV